MTIMDRHSLRPTLVIAGAAVAVVALATACSSGTSSASGGSSTPAAAPTSAAASGALIGTASSALGTVVVDGKGLTVYDFAPDTATTSACTGSCATFWPPVVAPTTLPASLPGITGALTDLTRADGSKQLVLNGHPLYTFAGDKAAGQANGQGKNLDGGLWWVLTPAGAEVTATTAPTTAPTSASTSASSSKAPGGGYGY
jgi:predicted lipoprotein with Yx(FWY)xxD motif